MKRRRNEIPRNRRGVHNNNNDNDSNNNNDTHFQRRVLGKRESTARAGVWEERKVKGEGGGAGRRGACHHGRCDLSAEGGAGEVRG